VRQCFSNVRAITHMARKQKYLVEDPGEDETIPLTDSADKPVIAREHILALLGAIDDVLICASCTSASSAGRAPAR
jgi:hypothetical protein